MKLATRLADSRLLIVSQANDRILEATIPTLIEALESWERSAPQLAAQYQRLNEGEEAGAMPLDHAALAAALPRTYQFLDASAFLAHNHILARAWGFEPRGEAEPPLMYQGISHLFYPPHAPIPFRSTDDLIDLEAEFAVITDEVPMGIGAEAALDHVKLIVVLNDWSLRAYGPGEMKGGFGFLQAKPPCSMSAVAVTPDELGENWRRGRVHLPLTVQINNEPFGRPDGGEMHFSFGDLIAHAAATRDLCAGTVIGSGTVSNMSAADVGSGCIAERRALDKLGGREETSYLRFGDRVRLSAEPASRPILWDSLDQEVVQRRTV